MGLDWTVCGYLNRYGKSGDLFVFVQCGGIEELKHVQTFPFPLTRSTSCIGLSPFPLVVCVSTSA